jgi:hypothetical protein
LEDIRRLDAQIRESRKKLGIAVKASCTSLTGIFGRRPGHRRHRDGDVARFSFTASGVAFNGGSRWAGARQAGQ